MFMRNILRRGRLVAILVVAVMLATPALLMAQDNTSATMVDD